MAQPRTVEELERLLQEATQRAERELQRAERERQRAEGERQRAEREQQRADEAEREMQPTTLSEYMAGCHSLVFSRFTVETNPILTSKGSIPAPRDKWCPERLRPWPHFLDQQRMVFGTLYDLFPIDSRLFENHAFLAGLGNRVSQRRIADERMLEYFLHISVEDPVRAIIQQLKEVGPICEAFEIGDGVIFENHPHALSEVAEEVVEREVPPAPQTPNHRQNLSKLRPDQICVYRSDDTPFAQRTMVFVSEYKPPHKLTAPHLRLGLRAMDLFRDVVNRQTIPTSVDPIAQFQYHADKLTASAVSQTYHYMIESGLEYGLLTTGEAIVFLMVDWDEPETLYYHLAEPGPEALAHPGNLDVCTAVGQYLAFTLMALGLPGEQRGHGQDERRRVQQNLKKWAEDFETTARSIPTDQRVPSPDNSSAFRPTTYREVDRSPYLFRRRDPRRGDRQIDGVLSTRRDDRREPSDDESAPRPPDTPTPLGRRTNQDGARRSQRLTQQPPRGRGGEQDREYCTQQCLLGLLRQSPLDPKCPNVALHHRKNRAYARARHPVDHAEWLKLLWKQLERSLDDGITRTGQSGARGVLFKVTLLEYGYTFVGKGTVRAFIKDLEHEAAVYDRLKPAQGLRVPVFLGAIDLRSMNRTYYYDHRVYVVHLTFLSWGGSSMRAAADAGASTTSLRDMAVQSLKALHQRGVVHKDVRLPNMLFNREINGVMVIDFERASILQPPRPPLTHLVSNKRRREPERMDRKMVGGKPTRQRRPSGSFAEDILMATTMFGY